MLFVFCLMEILEVTYANKKYKVFEAAVSKNITVALLEKSFNCILNKIEIEYITNNSVVIIKPSSIITLNKACLIVALKHKVNIIKLQTKKDTKFKYGIFD